MWYKFDVDDDYCNNNNNNNRVVGSMDSGFMMVLELASVKERRCIASLLSKFPNVVKALTINHWSYETFSEPPTEIPGKKRTSKRLVNSQPESRRNCQKAVAEFLNNVLTHCRESLEVGLWIWILYRKLSCNYC